MSVNWPFLPNRNIEIVRAEGVFLYDAQARPILDAAGGAIVSNVGHGRERVVEAVAQATRDTSYVVPPWLTPSRRKMMTELQDHWLPDGLPRVHITSGGSEGVESAVKLAVQYQAASNQPERVKVIARDVSYHGTTFMTTALSGHPARKKGLVHALPPVVTVPTPYPLRSPLGSDQPESGEYYAELLRDTLEAEGPETVAALIAEPITGSSGGAIVPPEDYWPEVREICNEYGVLLIMDEVMTGFGRTGVRFGFEHWDVLPDILVAGKGMAGGYAPLGGVYATEAIGQAIEKAGMNVMFHTFGAHPAACAAAAEVLAILREEELVQRSADMGAVLNKRLHDTFSNHPNVAEIRGRGLLQAIEVVKDRDSLERFSIERAMTNRIVTEGLRRGVFFYGGGTGEVRDIVCMGPAFIISEEQIDQIVSVLEESVTAAVATAVSELTG